MKGRLFGMLGAGLVIAGCQPGKGTGKGEKLPSEPSEEMARSSGVALAKLQRGRVIYIEECGRCHDPMMPDDVSTTNWHQEISGMRWTSGISEDDQEAAMDYILAVMFE